MSENNERVRIGFLDHDGDPEAIWAVKVGESQYQLEGNAFFAYGVSLNDVVEAVEEEDGVLTFVRVVKKSGNRTIRVVTKEGEDSTNQFFKKVGKLGCRYEGQNERLFAVLVPPAVEMKTLADFLRKSDLDWEYADPTLAEVKLALEQEKLEKLEKDKEEEKGKGE